MGNPATLPADFFSHQEENPATLPSDFSFEEKQDVPALKPSHVPIDHDKMAMSMLWSQMTGMPASLAYENQDQIHEELGNRGVEVPKLSTGIANDIKVGLQSTVIGLASRMKMPEQLKDPGLWDDFVSSVASVVGDLPVIISGVVGGAAAGSEVPIIGNVAGGVMGGFALPAAMRKSYMLQIEKGNIKDFGDLMYRTADVSLEATKGAATGLVFSKAGAATIPLKALGPVAEPLAAATLKGVQQAAAITLAGDLLNEQVPNAREFERNVPVIVAMNLVTHGMPLKTSESKQALQDVYVKDGTTPEESATKLQAQPPVKPEMAEGLKPAIRITSKDGSPQVISGENETHSDVAERATGQRPVTIEELEADPKMADRVLSQPETHVQQVIDRAYEIKSEQGDANLPPKSQLKSGRGFQTTSGDYLSRSQAKRWVKENEPDVYEAWAEITTGDEFHSADYINARQRVAARDLAEGAPQLSGVPLEVAQFLAKNRSELNKIKAGDAGDGYGKSVIRTTFVGVRNTVRAQAEQLAGRLAKLVPDHVDQEALSFLRDYRDAPDELRAEIEDIRAGDNERLKRAIPSMERALEPTPAMLEADKKLTDYFTQANVLRRKFVDVGSSIDPARYSPRNFMLVEDEEAKGGTGTARFSKRSPHDIRREYLRLLDPLKSGEVEARTFNAIDGLRVYGDRIGTSVATSTFQMELENSQLGKNGVTGQLPPGLKDVIADSNILTPKEIEELGGIPKDWVDLPGTAKTVVSGGKQFRTGFKVPPMIAEAMEPMLQKDVLSGAQYWKVAKLTQAYIKSIELGLSLFHMRALTLSFINNAGIDAYREAMVSDNNSPEFELQERHAALYGVTTTKTGVPIEAYRGLRPDSLEDRNTLLAKVKEGYEPVDKVFKSMTRATFEVAQRKFKVIDFSMKEARWLAKHPQATEAEYGTSMRSIAKEVNAVYGGLNWDVMGVSANFQAIGRMFLLAPDWTFSNVANLKYASEGGAGGNAARAFWIKSFITGAIMTQGMSLFLTGQKSKQWDKVYLGKDEKGKELYSSIFFVGAPKDAISTINSTMRDGFPAGTIEFSVNKASPLV